MNMKAIFISAINHENALNDYRRDQSIDKLHALYKAVIELLPVHKSALYTVSKLLKKILEKEKASGKWRCSRNRNLR